MKTDAASRLRPRHRTGHRYTSRLCATRTNQHHYPLVLDPRNHAIVADSPPPVLHKAWVVGVAWLSLITPALAQEHERGRAETPSSAVSGAPEMVVTGKRTSDQDIRDFVGVLEMAPGNRQIARFERRSACPAAIGFSPIKRALVVARLRKVATAAHIPLAGTACRPNVVLMVTDDKPAMMRFLAEKSQRYFPNPSAARSARW